VSDTATRIAGPILMTTGAQTYYTVPANTTTIIRSIHIANTSGTAATATLSIGADAAGTRLLPAKSIAANEVYHLPCFIVLTAAETLRGLAGTTNVLTLTVSGVEVANG
jgi:hypothetical protein